MRIEESKMIAALQEEALNKMQAARIALLNNMPFYGLLLSGLPLEANWTWLSTAATDHRKLYYNPEFICGMPAERKVLVFQRVDADQKMSPDQKKAYKVYIDVFYAPKTVKEIIFILLHELKHVTNDHIARGKAYSMEQYNIASDHYINVANVMEMGPGAEKFKWFRNGRQTVFEEGKEFAFLKYCHCDFQYFGMTAEQIYSLLFKKGEGSEEKKGLGEHMGEKKDEKSENILGYSDPQPTMSDVEKEEALSYSEDMIIAAVTGSGETAPESMRELVTKLQKPKVDYMRIIKQRMMSRRKTTLSYSKLARRAGSLTLQLRKSGHISNSQFMVLPGRKKLKQIDIVVGFDVSGSISNKTLERIFSEIMAMVSMYDEFKVTMFCWSTMVGDVKVYTRANAHEMRDYKVRTTGGTLVSCAFQYIDEFIPKAKDVILFTDGGIESLAHRKDWGRKYDTLWILSGARKGWVAPFGKVVDLDE